MKKTNTFERPSATQRIHIAIALLSFMLMGVASVHADILASYDMQTSAARNSPSSVNADVSAGSLTGNNLNAYGASWLSDGSDFYTTWSRASGTDGTGQTTADQVLSVATYFSLTLTPDAGKQLDFSSLSFDAFASTGNTGSQRQIYVFTDKTGFASGDQLLSVSTFAGYDGPLIPYNTASVGQNFSVDLTGVANVADSITFRFYVQAPDAGQSLSFDDITLNGSVVPEPASMALISVAGLALFILRRLQM